MYFRLVLFPILAVASSLAHAVYTYNLDAPKAGDELLTLSSVANGGSDSFSAVLRHGAGTSNVGVILLRGRANSHIDGYVIQPLRLELANQGYATLSIDTPIPSGGEAYVNYRLDAAPGGTGYVFPELYARVGAATDELQSRGIDKAILIGFSLGAREGAAYMSYGTAGSIPIVGFVGVGMGTDTVTLLDTPSSIAGITVPTLDLYGEYDETFVLDGTVARAESYTGPSYTQIMQPGASHNWYGFETELVGHVTPWITNVALIPETETWAMLLVGLILVSAVARCRNEAEI